MDNDLRPERVELAFRSFRESLAYAAPEMVATHVDQLEQRVAGILTSPGLDGTLTLTVDRIAAERLAESWENTDSLVMMVSAVRDVFAGQDGYLHILNEALGWEH
jgi:hypothetical protein